MRPSSNLRLIFGRNYTAQPQVATVARRRSPCPNERLSFAVARQSQIVGNPGTHAGARTGTIKKGAAFGCSVAANLPRVAHHARSGVGVRHVGELAFANPPARRDTAQCTKAGPR